MHHVLYARWYTMVRRCTKIDDSDYPSYGGRGITIYQPWLSDFSAYCEYVRSLPNYDLSLQLDRKDNDGNYEPGNLQWTTPRQNSSNTRRTVKVVYENEEITVAELARRTGTPRQRIGGRLNLGWSVEEAISNGDFRSKVV